MSRKYAILIGVEHYDDRNITPLACAANVALSLAEVLRGMCGFDSVRWSISKALPRITFHSSHVE